MIMVPPTLTFFKIPTPNDHGSTNIVEGFVYLNVHGSMNIDHFYSKTSISQWTLNEIKPNHFE